MKKLNRFVCLYAGAVVLLALGILLYQQPLLCRILSTLGAVILDVTVVLDWVRRVREQMPVLSWVMIPLCAAVAFSISTVLDWITYFT